MEIKTEYERWHSSEDGYIDKKYYAWIMNQIKPGPEDVVLDV